MELLPRIKLEIRPYQGRGMSLTYKSVIGAPGGIRTHNPLILSQVPLPVGLRRHYSNQATKMYSFPNIRAAMYSCRPSMITNRSPSQCPFGHGQAQ